ncbi:MAG TPA: lysylphosphatidylglycerol synthase domain-containing protein [Gaiellales bacterium]|nr:lysylphosphatidylglycerol synthase domain-containing protein [Gaiellales bacterium]
MVSWLESLWDNLTAVSLPLLLLGLAFQASQTMLVALAWRNILRAAYPKGGVTYRPILSYYAGGTALNGVLPASAGTVAMLGFFRTSIPGSTVSGLLGATVVENVFFAVVAVVIYAWLFLDKAGSFDVHFGWFSDHVGLTILLVIGSALLIAISLRILWRRAKTTWANAKEGGAILGQPRKFLTQVVGVEAVSYVARMGVNATFMKAFHIPVSLTNVFLIVAASSISSTVAIAPGAVGAQTALASVVLKGVAPASAISAYAIGQQIITTAWNVGFGLVLLAREIGWKATRRLVHFRKKKEGEAGDLEAAASGEAETEPPPESPDPSPTSTP